ncbi:MAG: winged helix DNA-binding protein [Deltaproteobacteria bacterium]|nr:winged helix DNA-binding protein [Deltaproteobacteria bacterium]
MAATAREFKTQTDAAVEFLEFFYPIHYKLGMTLEDALRSGTLTRKQVAILWLIRSEGKGKSMRRKDIEQRIATWFEVSSSAITKALRAMARPPLGFVQVVEDPRSGREKLVRLTAKGERFLSTMVAEGENFIRTILDHLTAEEARTGSHFLSRVTEVLDQLRVDRDALNNKR